MTPPDSDVREVLQICGGCGLVLPVPNEHVCPRPRKVVLLPLPLAQRILAALEHLPRDAADMHLRRTLASELRAVIGK